MNYCKRLDYGALEVQQVHKRSMNTPGVGLSNQLDRFLLVHTGQSERCLSCEYQTYRTKHCIIIYLPML